MHRFGTTEASTTTLRMAGVWQQFLRELQDHKFSAHNFFGFTQDATVSTLFHYPPDTFAICSQLNRRTHSCLGGLRRQAIRLRISEPSLALWQPGPTGPGSPRAGALPR